MKFSIFDSVRHLFEDVSIVSSEEEKERRMNICNSCSLLDSNICLACSCYLPVKISFASSSCPKGKWEEEK